MNNLPKDPPIGLLISMAIRYDHGLAIPEYYNSIGMDESGRWKSTLIIMRQLYEEVSGNGFYKPELEEKYKSYLGLGEKK